MAGNFSLPTVLANLAAGNEPLSLIDGDFNACYNPLVALGTFSNYYADTGAANAYVVTVSSPQTVSQTAGLVLTFLAAHRNTGASTLQINALAVKNILNHDGSALVAGQIPANSLITVAYDGTQYQIIRTVVNATNFGFLTTATSAANKTALTAAITALGSNGGEIIIPAGSYSCDAGITIINTQKNITISGAGSAMGYEAPTAGTRIIFTATGGTVGFDLTTVVSAGNYTCLRNMSVDGNNACQYPVKIVGIALLEHFNVTACTASGAGVWLNTLVNQTRLTHFSAIGNNGYGVLIGTTAGGGGNTIMSMEHFNIRSNLIGMRITDGIHIAFRDGVIESNTQEGLQVNQPTGGQVGYLSFDTVWIENNWAGTSNYNMTVDSGTHDFTTGPPSYLQFTNCAITCSGTTKAMNIVALRYGEFENLQVTASAAIDLGTYASYVVFKDINGGTITDSGNRNFTFNRDTSGPGGYISSKAIVQPSPTANYVWNSWNPSDIAGTLTNAPNAGTSTTNSTHFSLANSSGTVTITFATPGKYIVTFTLGCTNAESYTTEYSQVVLGGTATQQAARSAYEIVGNSNRDYSGAIQIMVTATATQTLTILPKGSTTFGGGNVANHSFRAEVTALLAGS